jgi:formylglycine-generating enzyme required for sulfatase activity
MKFQSLLVLASTIVLTLGACGKRENSAAIAAVNESPTKNEFALIPAGSFSMGDHLDGDKNAPEHEVTVRAFSLAKYEVTKALWDEVSIWGACHGYTDLHEGEGKVPNHPVVCINWYDMVKWCNALSERDKLTPCFSVSSHIYRTGNSDDVVCDWTASGYRLPTESEWEKAARGGLIGKRFPWGDEITHAEANFTNNGYETYQSGTIGGHPTYTSPHPDSGYLTSPVGSFKPNGYGLYDMAGNVVEVCWDRYAPYPGGSRINLGSDTLNFDRVLRGGAWHNLARYCRVAFRNSINPSNANGVVGFRIARSALPTP